MTCPVCKRELAPTLSICYACGTMVQDSVREELATKIGRASKPLEFKLVEQVEKVITTSAPDVVAYAEPELVRAVPNPPIVERPQAAQVERAVRPRGDQTERISRHTSPTLVGFQNPKSDVPDWRLQLQNSIRQRKAEPITEQQPLIPGLHTHLVTNGATALKARYIPEPEQEPARSANPRLENAMKRIEDSRRKFSNSPKLAETTPAASTKNYPFNVVESSSMQAASAESAKPATVNAIPRPRLVSKTNVTPRKGLDTNKLPAIAEVSSAPILSAPPIVERMDTPAPELEPIRIEIVGVEIAPVEVQAPVLEPEVEEVDDLAPLSTRLTAGLFDVIIAGFGTAILMSPLFVRGGEWLSTSGIIAIAAAFGIMLFTYLTVGIGLRGRTLGMKIFSLEVIDIEANEYPTFHQSAVRSAVFILGLPLLGIGFLPAFFNDERRAAHDLVSGTILVREL
ncbi:MAG: RDD family protein [bacterium]|nr:RDD family protein [bacterium]